MHWENADYKLEIDEVFGNENTLDLDSSVSILRKFLVRQVELKNVSFEPIPYTLARQIFYDHVMQFERVYDDLPFKQIRFTEHPDGAGEIFNAEVTYSWDIQKNTDDQQQEFTLPTFSLMGGKKKQLLPVITYDKKGKAINEVKRYTKSDSVKPIDYKMLGWDGKQFNGVEIEDPDLKFMVPAWYPAHKVDTPFIKRLMEFVGSVNINPFYGLKPNECKYLGPEQSWVTRVVETGDKQNPVQMIRMLELQHHFHAQLTQYDVEIGDIKIPEIPGWDQVDIHYEESLVDIGDGNKVPLATAQQVDVVPVKKLKDLWDLFNGKILEEEDS